MIASHRFCRCLDPFSPRPGLHTVRQEAGSCCLIPLKFLVFPEMRAREDQESYRILSKLFHPDLNDHPEAQEARFREIQWACKRRYSGSKAKGRAATAQPHEERNARSDPADWSEKPFGGFCRAVKAYASEASHEIVKRSLVQLRVRGIVGLMAASLIPNEVDMKYLTLAARLIIGSLFIYASVHKVIIDPGGLRGGHQKLHDRSSGLVQYLGAYSAFDRSAQAAS